MHNQPVGTLFLKLFFLPWVPQALVWNLVGCGTCGRHPKKNIAGLMFFLLITGLFFAMPRLWPIAKGGRDEYFVRHSAFQLPIIPKKNCHDVVYRPRLRANRGMQHAWVD